MSASPERIGRYEIRRTLGQGAMGTVYEALDPLIERVVAVKTINLNLSGADHSERQSRFFREAKSAGRLNHPNIVTIYDVGEADDVAYIAMEYLTGQSLRGVLDSGVVLSMSRIAKIVSSIASALDYAHENGVVHRDIKPANVMVAADYSVKLMDFGIAQLSSSSPTMLGTLLGSPKYMAPEQLDSRPVDGRSDIFSLGVLLYELLTARAPFDADHLSAIMYKILHETAPAPSRISARVPEAFDGIVAKALAKRPEDRFQCARDMVAALERIDGATASSSGLVVAESALAVFASAPTHTSIAHAAGDATLILSPKRIGLTTDGTGGQRKQAAAGGEKSSAADSGRSSMLPAAMLGVVFLAALVAALSSRDTDKTDSASLAAAPASSAQSPHSLAVQAGESASSASRATLSLAIYPWGEVWVDGKRVGVSPPLNELTLGPGKHDIEIRNESLPPYRETVTLGVGDTPQKIRHKFQ
jgi:eukaryotic-like serine/threonine-protein kinase